MRMPVVLETRAWANWELGNIVSATKMFLNLLGNVFASRAAKKKFVEIGFIIYDINKQILESTPKRKLRLKSCFYCRNQEFNHVALVIRTITLLIFIFLSVSQSPITVSKIANCFVEIIIIEQFDFERNAKKISGFEHISSKIRDIEKIILLMFPQQCFLVCPGL